MPRPTLARRPPAFRRARLRLRHAGPALPCPNHPVTLFCADATTEVGSGIVQELLREGAVVIAPVAAADSVDALLADCAGCPTDTLLPVVADLASEEGCAALFEDVQREHGGVDHAVSVFGSLWRGGERAGAGAAGGRGLPTTRACRAAARDLASSRPFLPARTPAQAS